MPPFCEKHGRHKFRSGDGVLVGRTTPARETQPEHDGVGNEIKRCPCYTRTAERFEQCSQRAEHYGPCTYVSVKSERTFTHSELTTLLERMARLVVEEAAKLLDATGIRLGESIPPDYIQMINCQQLAKGTRAYFTPEKLQQLREAVERP